MANNRLYLVHRPSGYALFLGKRMLRGWYATGIQNSEFNAFYDRIDALYGEAPKDWREPHNPDNLAKAEEGQDDFILVLEDSSCAPYIAEETASEGDDGSNLIVRFKPAAAGTISAYLQPLFAPKDPK